MGRFDGIFDDLLDEEQPVEKNKFEGIFDDILDEQQPVKIEAPIEAPPPPDIASGIDDIFSGDLVEPDIPIGPGAGGMIITDEEAAVVGERVLEAKRSIDKNVRELSETIADTSFLGDVTRMANKSLDSIAENSPELFELDTSQVDARTKVNLPQAIFEETLDFVLNPFTWVEVALANKAITSAAKIPLVKRLFTTDLGKDFFSKVFGKLAPGPKGKALIPQTPEEVITRLRENPELQPKLAEIARNDPAIRKILIAEQVAASRKMRPKGIFDDAIKPPVTEKIGEIFEFKKPKLSDVAETKLSPSVSPKKVPIDVSPPAEPLPTVVEPPFSKAAKTPEKDIIGLNKEQIKEIRENTGLKELEPAEQRKWVPLLNEADPSKADLIADEILTGTPRVISDSEHVSMVKRAAQLKTELNDLITQKSKLIDSGDISSMDVISGKEQALNLQLDKLTEASDAAGREVARALNIRRMLVDAKTYDLATVTRTAKAVKGETLTPKEVKELESLVSTIDSSTKKIQELEANIDELIKKQSVIEAENVVKETKRARRVKAKSLKLKRERDDILKQIDKIGIRINDITGLTAEGSWLIGKYAINLIRSGANSLADVVSQVQAKIPDASKRQIYEALNTTKVKRKAISNTQKAIKDIKQEAKLLNKIEDAEKGIFDPAAKKKPSLIKIVDLRRKLAELRSAAFKSDRDQKTLQKIITKINEAQEQLDGQFRSIKGLTSKTDKVPAIETMRQKLRDIQSLMRNQDKLADLEEQLRTGVFKTKIPKKQRVVPTQLEQARINLRKARSAVDSAIADMAPVTIGRLGSELISSLRAIKATADMSGSLRQGMVLSLRHPIAAAKANVAGFKSFFSNNTAEQIDGMLRESPKQLLRDRAKLYMSPLEAAPLAKREEAFAGRLIQRIPGIGAVIKASERNMVTTLNMLRTSVFDDFVKKFPNATDEELKAMADYINVASGRGDLGQFTQAANKLALVMFSPRFAVSRFQTPTRIAKYWELPRVRKELAKDYAAFGIFGATVLGLAHLAGSSVGINPRDSDFGKVVVGNNTRVDFFAGFQQPMRLLTRIALRGTDELGITGKNIPDYLKEVDPLDLIGQFAAFKISPAISLPLQLLTGEDAVGQEVTRPEALLKAMIPIIVESSIEGFQVGGPEIAALTALGEFFGLGISNYKKKKSRLIKAIEKSGGKTHSRPIQFAKR